MFKSRYIKKKKYQIQFPQNSLVVQWLGLCAFTAEGTGSIPGRGSRIPQAAAKKKVDTVSVIQKNIPVECALF